MGGSFVLEIQTGGVGLVLQEIQVRGGLKNDPIHWGGGGLDFFWNNPIN